MATEILPEPEIAQADITDAFEFFRMLVDRGYDQSSSLSDSSNLVFDRDLCLLDPELDSDRCSNLHLRDGLWEKTPKGKENVEDLLQSLMQFSLFCKIRCCLRRRCLEMKSQMEDVAPPCNWANFREWALVLMSCQASCSGRDKLNKAHAQLAMAVSGCCFFVKSWAETMRQNERKFYDEKRERNALQENDDTQESDNGQEECSNPDKEIKADARDRIELYTVCDLIYWMLTAQTDMGIGPKNFGNWDNGFLPDASIIPAIQHANDQIQSLRICKQRIWNLIDLSPRKDSDMPELLRTIMKHSDTLALPASGRDSDPMNHARCTPNKCQLAQMDTSRLQQMHKCSLSRCELREIPVQHLDDALELGKCMAWDFRGPEWCLTDWDTKYMALSHVWSDGTGAGPNVPGFVNQCLLDFFTGLARQQGCDAIWWDVISVPSIYPGRTKALQSMHRNYTRAACTVIHDQYLANIDWREDGSPCIAFVLSTWFSRAWTALELRASHKTLVLFKDGETGFPVAKDLDTEILASRPVTASRAYWLATCLIRRIREPIQHIGDLVAILHSRTTALVRDRTKIHALLAEVPDCDLRRSEAAITEDILSHVSRIPHACLFHGKPTMRDSGPYSWCPATLDDLHVDVAEDVEGDQRKRNDYHLKISDDGCVEGIWRYRKVSIEDIRENKLSAIGNELAPNTKIKMALQNWRTCLILRHRPEGPALLVQTVKMDHKIRKLPCRYVGAVNEAGRQSATKPDEWATEIIVIGHDRKLDISAPLIRADNAISNIQDVKGYDEANFLGSRPESNLSDEKDSPGIIYDRFPHPESPLFAIKWGHKAPCAMNELDKAYGELNKSLKKS
ncbi:hypothetical protein P170DRAFT_471444 [Aspergillus steynii IBT 23096]|uniref:Heterokaryon incompatibility domain-containing protein n=1 Tax=Aspergillus steynii IBT 23096 TaxID=1392250 RepID=A0A2I2GF72_9EURO|nr:uncharacterized protein P170DRAFT_471444 [Aspergillus steynii IBT 23096]PLB51511.1 hypothetical protein P170DRAFT_471444 [Aspergillus steynii IBT 23096]